MYAFTPNVLQVSAGYSSASIRKVESRIYAGHTTHVPGILQVRTAETYVRTRSVCGQDLTNIMTRRAKKANAAHCFCIQTQRARKSARRAIHTTPRLLPAVMQKDNSTIYPRKCLGVRAHGLRHR